MSRAKVSRQALARSIANTQDFEAAYYAPHMSYVVPEPIVPVVQPEPVPEIKPRTPPPGRLRLAFAIRIIAVVASVAARRRCDHGRTAVMAVMIVAAAAMEFASRSGAPIRHAVAAIMASPIDAWMAGSMAAAASTWPANRACVYCAAAWIAAWTSIVKYGMSANDPRLGIIGLLIVECLVERNAAAIVAEAATMAWFALAC